MGIQYNNQSAKKNISDIKSGKTLQKKVEEQLINYPKRHFLQFILPLINQIFRLLNISGIIPAWLYNVHSQTYWQIIIVECINFIAVVGIIMEFHLYC